MDVFKFTSRVLIDVLEVKVLRGSTIVKVGATSNLGETYAFVVFKIGFVTERAWKIRVHDLFVIIFINW